MFRRIPSPVYVWIAGPGEPVDPGWGVSPPVDPGYGRPGWSPADPGYDIGLGLRPDNSLPWGPGHPSTGPIKPPGAAILPPSPDNGLPPTGHPWLPGHWRPVDPGYGLPPVWGWQPVDPGFGTGGGGGGTLPAGPGHWVPIDPDYGIPEHHRRCCPDKPHKPIWVWIAEIGPDFGTLPAPAPPPAQPKK
jgi:hypothetical protein